MSPEAPVVLMPLTAKQREILRIIGDYYHRNGEPPSQRFLARRLSIRLWALQCHLAALCSKGWLRDPTPAGLRCTHVP